MRIPLWIWRVNSVGIIAIANMVLFVACWVIHWIMFPDYMVHYDLEPEWKITVHECLEHIKAILTFPLGWIMGKMFRPHPMELIPFYVPINAYLWGAVGTFFIRSWKRCFYSKAPKQEITTNR